MFQRGESCKELLVDLEELPSTSINMLVWKACDALVTSSDALATSSDALATICLTQ